MTRRAFRRIGLALIAGVGGCADLGVPPDGTSSGEIALFGGRHAPVVVALADSAPRLEAYAAAFWAVQGRRTTFRLHYLAPDPERSGGELQKYLVLTIPAFTQIVHPDGTPLVAGDSLLITVTVDGLDLAVELGPDGAMFAGDPLQLALWLVYADLNPQLGASDLRIWYRPPGPDAWTPQPTRVIAGGKALIGDLRHFSNYAVAY